ncbi:putative nuclease HARBI1 [Folsomia candida]|uniref:putative nuclease HARBI1 n=1 Tax=Folsomia candida TaxID=158441 RepID=UPI000B907078|nr:putative nuclease HARBI1 [Folsomia candida]
MTLSRLQDYEDRLERIHIVPSRQLKDKSNPMESLSEHQFQSRYRLSKDATVFVADQIKNQLVSPLRRGVQIPPILQLLVALRFYAGGSFQIQVGDLAQLSQGTVSKLVKRVSGALAALRPHFIKYPNNNEANLVRQRFYTYGGFPGVVGAIDCTHVPIKSVGGDNAELFRDRHGNFSINVQAVCTSDLKVTNIVARWFGSCHDNRIFENSTLCRQLDREEVPGILVGDSGYSCTPYLMTPLTMPRTAAEKRYQSCQIKTRNPIERCFGTVKQRFNCLRYMRLKLSTTLTTIVACFVLHNIAIMYRDDLEFEYEDHEDDENENIRNQSTTSGISARNRIISSHFS